MAETIDSDSSKCSGSDKEVIQDALNSINNKSGLPIFLENEMINKEGKSDGVKDVEPVGFKINSCIEENSHEQGDNILNSDKNSDDDDENSLNVHKCASSETVLINRCYDNEFISVPPGEDSAPVSFSHDLFCEELSHPQLFPYGKN